MWAAAQNSNAGIITLLLKAGANPKSKSNVGKAACDYVEKNEKVKGTDAYLELQKATA